MRARFADRLFGSALALLLQAGFLFFLLQAVRLLAPAPKAARELTLILPRLAPAPETPSPARKGGAAPAIRAVPLPGTAPPAAAAPDAGALRGLGQSLFGCAPEAYALLPPEQRAHCPRPGENAPHDAAEDLYPKSHSRDAAAWQEDLDERHFDLSACMGAALVYQCQIDAMKAERSRAAQARTFIASDKAKARAAPKPPMPDIPVRRGR